MPLYNGKEIKVKPGQPEAIQKSINAIPDLKADLKSDIVPAKSTEDQFLEQELGFGTGFNLFEEENKSYVKRKDRYGWFREMDEMEFIHRALEIVADDSTQVNDEGNQIKIYSDDEDTKDVLEELFHDRLDLNNDIWTIVYESCKMGDNFYEVIVDDYNKPKKVIALRYLEPDKVERIEKDGKLSHFVYRTEIKNEVKGSGTAVQGISTKEEQLYRLMPWQIVHFKLDNKSFEPYGGSLLNPGIKTYRRLSLLEDVMLVYRISRAPERRVFYIDTGNMNRIEARRFLEKIKNAYRSQAFIDEDGKINRKAHMLSINSDIFVPVPEGRPGTRIETLQGGEALNNIDDMKYFRDKILRTMNIPPAYMGDETDRSRGTLSQLDIKFSRFIERIQSQIIKGLNKIAALELFFHGMKKEDLSDFEIELTPPSNIKEVTEIDIASQRMGLIATIQSLEIFPNQWMLKNILKLSDREISDIMLYKQLEGQTQPGAEGGGMPPGGMPGGMPPDVGMPGEEIPGGETAATVGGAVPPGVETPEAGVAPAPAELAANTMIRLYGRDFLVENKDDFFKMIKHLKEQEEIGNNPSFSMEAISKVFEKSEVRPNTNNITSQIILNELGGLDIKERKIKIYESYKSKKGGKVEQKFRTKTITLED